MGQVVSKYTKKCFNRKKSISNPPMSKPSETSSCQVSQRHLTERDFMKTYTIPNSKGIRLGSPNQEEIGLCINVIEHEKGSKTITKCSDGLYIKRLCRPLMENNYYFEFYKMEIGMVVDKWKIVDNIVRCDSIIIPYGFSLSNSDKETYIYEKEN